jgi:hypothetical protein
MDITPELMEMISVKFPELKELNLSGVHLDTKCIRQFETMPKLKQCLIDYVTTDKEGLELLKNHPLMYVRA